MRRAGLAEGCPISDSRSSSSLGAAGEGPTQDVVGDGDTGLVHRKPRASLGGQALCAAEGLKRGHVRIKFHDLGAARRTCAFAHDLESAIARTTRIVRRPGRWGDPDDLSDNGKDSTEFDDDAVMHMLLLVMRSTETLARTRRWSTRPLRVPEGAASLASCRDSFARCG